MTGTNNFLPFDSTNANMMTDSVYAASTVRTNGVVTGQADPTSHNKALHQSTSMAAALAAIVADNGTNISDADPVALKTALLSLFSYQTAQGTATSLILQASINQPITFIAKYANGGAATSVNGIPLYSLNVGNPVLTPGQIYTIWYSASDICFYTNATARIKSVIATFTASSTWTCPPGITDIDVFVGGAGAGGGAYQGNGGGGGYCKLFSNIAITPGTGYPVVVGLGGAGGVGVTGGNIGNAGANGGQSYFNTTTYSANGGTGSTMPAISNGGSGGGNYGSAGASLGRSVAGGGVGGGNLLYTPVNPYDGIQYGCGGGGYSSPGGGAGSGNIGGGGDGPAGAGGITGGGAGGGGSYSSPVTGGAGGSGIVIIYA
jgi:hypothetical protein